MAIIVDNETYDRFVYDPDDVEAVFKVDGKTVEVEQVAKLVEKGGKVELSQRIKEDANPIKVTFKKLRAVDKTAIEDTVQMEYGVGSGQVAPGSMRRLAIKRGVVKWSYEVSWSENVMDNLDPQIFEQLYGWLCWGSEPPRQDEETGLMVPLDEEPPSNRAQRRAVKSPKKTAAALASVS